MDKKKGGPLHQQSHHQDQIKDNQSMEEDNVMSKDSHDSSQNMSQTKKQWIKSKMDINNENQIQKDLNQEYQGQSITQTMNQINDQQKRLQSKVSQSGKRGTNIIEDQYNKKQMEFKGGRLNSLMSDHEELQITNKIYANRYQGYIQGTWYFLIDSVMHFENVLALMLLTFILISKEYNQIDITFPIAAVTINVCLMALKNLTLEFRQRRVSNFINTKQIEWLMITRRVKRWIPISWQDIKIGYILRVKSGQEFPADCLILDIQGAAGQKCFVTTGPFDDTTGIVQKKSYSGTSNKIGQIKNEQHLVDMLTGFLKFEYNYFGFVQGVFKLHDNPLATEFDHENVVQRGAILTQTPQVICLVLNVGIQCIGSVYKDPQETKHSSNYTIRLRSMVKSQRSFDKAYKHSIRIFLLSITILYFVFTGLSLYLSVNETFKNISYFEKTIMDTIEWDMSDKIRKGLAFFSILLSSLPLSFSNIIDLLVLTHTNFAEWDINIAPANIEFLQPHATLAFGKVAHMFFSRTALQRDDFQFVKVFHVGKQFYLNSQNKKKLDQSKDNMSDSDDNAHDQINTFNSFSNSYDKETSLEYLPNELQYSNKFKNEEVESLMYGPDTPEKLLVTEFFRGIVLCHQASVMQDNTQEGLFRYICVLHDEMASLEFAQQQDFKLIQRNRKQMTVVLQGQTERYEELGVVTTKAVMGHFLTVSAVRLHGKKEGLLFMKGSIAALKHYFVNKENEFQYLNLFEQKFIHTGVQSIVYAKRQLTQDETNQLIITINEGVTHNINEKLHVLLHTLTSIQLEVLGILGVQKTIHLRNRVTVDDMMFNGVKPWLVSKEDEQSHLTSLNSFRMFHNCASSLVINGQRESIVMEQIQNALKEVTERLYKKSQEENYELNQKKKEKQKLSKEELLKKFKFKGNENSKPEKERSSMNQRNVVIFTGRALVEILRDQTMEKSFMTLAYMCDLMVGSEISPLQKQNLIRIVKSYIGEAEYVAAIVATSEDQFMVNEADIVANFTTNRNSTDFIAVSDVTFKDFSAISYLLFKHGNQIQMRLSKAAMAFFYRSLLIFLILSTYMIKSGFSGAMPYTENYYFVYMLFMEPLKILVFAIFYKDYAYDYLYRIFGHYKYNFSFSLVETEFVILDSLCALFDWAVVYMPFELMGQETQVSLIDGHTSSKESYNCYQVLIIQITIFYYFRNTNVQVIDSFYFILFMTVMATMYVLADDHLVGITLFCTTPSMIFVIIFQTLVLSLRNTICEVLGKLVIKRYANQLDWYADVEDRLSFEEYEDPNQLFSIHQYPPLYQSINSATVQNTLRLINRNMMKIPRNDVLEQILDKINTELEFNMRGNQQLAMSGSINKITLQLNDLNKETEYQDNKNSREIEYVQRQMIVFILTTLIFTIFGFILSMTLEYTNIGIYYYVSLSLFSIGVYIFLPRILAQLSNILLFYTVIIIFCYTIYTSESESLQPTGLIFVLALVAGLNHSFIYITMIMIITSVMMNIFFSLVTDQNQKELNAYVQTFSTAVNIFSALVWSAYVYLQELDKKTQFVNGHRIVRNYVKLRSILNVLVHGLVRDKLRLKRNIPEEEGEVTVIFIQIHQFEELDKIYHNSGNELLQTLNQIYNTFDQLSDQYGLQCVEILGKTYMAVGGLKSAEKKMDEKLLNKHHSVRVTDFATDILNAIKNIYLKNSINLSVSIGIHTGPVVSAIIGEVKPQFMLTGETIKKAGRICLAAPANRVMISKQTKHFLQLYTNNYRFTQNYKKVKNFKQGEYIFIVSQIKERNISEDQDHRSRLMKQLLAKSPNDVDVEFGPETEILIKKMQAKRDQAVENHDFKYQNEQQVYEIADDSADNEGNFDMKQNRILMEHENDQEEGFIENESHKSYQLDPGTMNVFGFNDDLNHLDDRIIVQSATENQLYNLVERPRYLLQFELKDNEREFLFFISKSEAKKTTSYLALLILLNKIVIIGDVLSQFNPNDQQFTVQFFLMFPIFLYELVLIYKLNNPNIESVYWWTSLLHVYGILVLFILLSYQVKYLSMWTIAGFNELQIQLTLSLIFMMRNVLLRHYIITYAFYVCAWIITVSMIAKKFEYQIIQFILGQIMYSILLATGIHHREMIQRKQINYERVISVETEKTNQLISKLVPFHILYAIKNDERQVDELADLTLLYVKITGMQQAVGQGCSSLREAVIFKQKLIARLDQVCSENKVFKIHLVGNLYLIMGYNGKLLKNKNNARLAALIEETERVIKTAMQMIDVINDIKSKMSSVSHVQNLNLRAGIHTGPVIAGIIGAKVVRYDIFGSGVMVTEKVEQASMPGKVCISQDTHRVLHEDPTIAMQYQYQEYEQIYIESQKRKLNSFIIERKENTINQAVDTE